MVKEFGGVAENILCRRETTFRKEMVVETDLALPGPEIPIIDETRLLEEFGGDLEILAELRDLFMEHVPPLFEEIIQSAASGDMEAISKQAHSLKGACATYGAPRLAMVCKIVELAGRAGDNELVQEHMDALQREYDGVCENIVGIGI